MSQSDRERNYEIVNQAIRKLLVPALEAFIKREMQKPEKLQKLGVTDWLKAAIKPLKAENCDGDEPKWYDPQVLLKIISDDTNWIKVFRIAGKIDVAQRGYINIILGSRNEQGHFNVDIFTTDYTFFFFDAMARLLNDISAPQAQEAEELKQYFLEKYYTELSGTTKKIIEAGINWLSCCSAMLEAQKQRHLTTNSLTASAGMVFDLDDIYVPLGFVQWKQLKKRSKEDGSPEKGSELYQEESIPIEHDTFFGEVLKKGKSEKSNGKRIAIIGEPGAGKTTQLQKIADWVLKKTECLPIWISLAELQGKTLEQYLLQVWLKTATQSVRVKDEMEEALGELFNSGRVWLLLDGVDEMVSESGNALAKIAKQLEGWVASARIVLTCRLNVWDANKNALYNFDVYKKSNFTQDQVSLCISNWFKDNLESGKRLDSELNQPGKERIRDLVKNPLRLALLCRAWKFGEEELPDTKSDLYDQFVKTMYRWKDEYFPTNEVQREALNQALGQLARQALESLESRFLLRESSVREVLNQYEPQLFQLAIDLGWLNRVGITAEKPIEEVYAFYHPTFEEYFAALNIDDWHYFLNHVPDNPAQGTYRIFEPQWKEVILLWLGREDIPKEQKEEFIKALREFRDGCNGFYGYRAYFLASVGIAEFGDCDCADEILEQLVKWSLNDYNPYQELGFWLDPVMEAAQAALRETDINHEIAVLNKWFNSNQDKDIHLRLIPLLTSIAYGNSDANNILIKLMSKSYSDEIRCNAALSLGKMQSKKL